MSRTEQAATKRTFGGILFFYIVGFDFPANILGRAVRLFKHCCYKKGKERETSYALRESGKISSAGISAFLSHYLLALSKLKFPTTNMATMRGLRLVPSLLTPSLTARGAHQQFLNRSVAESVCQRTIRFRHSKVGTQTIAMPRDHGVYGNCREKRRV